MWGKGWINETRGQPGGGDAGLSQVVTGEWLSQVQFTGCTAGRVSVKGQEELITTPRCRLGRHVWRWEDGGYLRFHRVPLTDCEKHRGEGTVMRFITVLQAGPASLSVGSVKRKVLTSRKKMPMIALSKLFLFSRGLSLGPSWWLLFTIKWLWGHPWASADPPKSGSPGPIAEAVLGRIVLRKFSKVAPVQSCLLKKHVGMTVI